MAESSSSAEKNDDLVPLPWSYVDTNRRPKLSKSVGAVVKKRREADENPLQLNFERFADNDVERVVKETRRLFQDQHWGIGSIEEAFKRMWKNIRDSEKRKEKGTYNLHQEKSKSAKRKRTKLQRGQAALTSTDWSPSQKEKVSKALTLDMTSPEKSEGTNWRSMTFIWESSRMAKTKLELDEIHKESLSTRARRKLLPTLHGEEFTRTPPPTEADPWTISKNY